MDNGDLIKLNVWDTAGQERYNSLIPMYTRNSDIVILTFSLTDRVSFNNLVKWKETTKYSTNLENLKFIIIGNKSDLENYICITDQGYSEILNFFIIPINKFLFSLFIIFAFFFSSLTISEVFEDYIANEKIKNVANRLLYISAIGISFLTIIIIFNLK